MYRIESMPKDITSGIKALDGVLQGLRLGDNVVWQVDELSDYRHFTEPFVRQALKDKRKVVYFRFAPHEPILKASQGPADNQA